MQGWTRTLLWVVAVCLAGLTACATTEITGIWKDPEYRRGPIQRIMVMGIAKRLEMRTLFEDEFSQQLRIRGTEAVPSHTVMPSDAVVNKKLIAEKLKEVGADAVLITRLKARTTERRYLPGTTYTLPPDYFYNYYNYYDRSSSFAEAPSRVSKEELSLLETNLYDAETEKLIWSAQSETWMMNTDKELIRSFVSVMLTKLAADKLIK